MKEERPAEGGFIRAVRWLDRVLLKIESRVAAVFYIIMIIAVIVGIVMRFVLRVPNQYGEELSRYMMIVSVLLGISIGVRKKVHLGVEGFVALLPGRARAVVNAFASLVTTATYGFMAYLSYAYMMTAVASGQRSAAMELPIWIVYLFLLIGFGLATVRAVMLFWQDAVVRRPVLDRTEEDELAL